MFYLFFNMYLKIIINLLNNLIIILIIIYYYKKKYKIKTKINR